MTRVVADDLDNDQVSSLVEFITATSNAQLARHGKTVEVTGLTNKKIKFLLHKFLYTRHLPDYGVLDPQATSRWSTSNKRRNGQSSTRP